MHPDAEQFFSLGPGKKRAVHILLCLDALEVWVRHAGGHGPIHYTESVVGTSHEVDARLPADAFDAVRRGADSSDVEARYREPIAAMQDDDLVFPKNVTFAYHSIHNLFRKYVLNEEVDDWLIVNQAVSSLDDEEAMMSALGRALRKAL